jgi:hypothetical protein
MPKTLLLAVAACLIHMSASAQISITVGTPKIARQTAIVPLSIKNNLKEPVVSARAVMFLLDSQGKVIGQANRFIIGGDTNHPPLLVGTTNAYHFAIPTSGKPFVTNRLTVTNVRLAAISIGGGQTHPSELTTFDGF